MAVSEFGKKVRIARLETGETLQSMAKKMETSVAFLSALETGRKKIPTKKVEAIISFFRNLGYEFQDDLQVLANVSNEEIQLDGLPLQQQMLISGFAKSSLNKEQLDKFAQLLKEINQK